MRAAGALPARPLEVVVWRCEEPVRFAHGKVGSLLFSGQIARADLHPVQDPPLDLDAALRADGERPRRGPVARRGELPGAAHRAGPPAGGGRRPGGRGHRGGGADPAARVGHRPRRPLRRARRWTRAATRCARPPSSSLAVERAGRAESRARVRRHDRRRRRRRPGAMNVVPGAATLLIDIRGIDAPSMERVRAAISAAADEIAAAPRRRDRRATRSRTARRPASTRPSSTRWPPHAARSGCRRCACPAARDTTRSASRAWRRAGCSSSRASAGSATRPTS